MKLIGVYESPYGPIRVWAGGYPESSISIGRVFLEFSNGRSGSIETAVGEGWIEPEDVEDIKFWIVEKILDG